MATDIRSSVMARLWPQPAAICRRNVVTRVSNIRAGCKWRRLEHRLRAAFGRCRPGGGGVMPSSLCGNDPRDFAFAAAVLRVYAPC